jgi:RNA polymerase sigma factor for flagellar operon FliA
MSQQTVGRLMQEYLAVRESAKNSGENGARDKREVRRAEVLRYRLLVNYSPLVKYVVGRVSARSTNPTKQEELVSSGVIGLLGAIETYDPEREAKFQTYAISKIRWSILDELRKEDHVSRRIRARAKETERAKDALTQRMKRTPTEVEIAQELDISVSDYRNFLQQYSQSQLDSLDEPVETDAGSYTIGRQLSSGEEDPSESVEREEVRQQLVQAMTELNERERTVVTLYFYEGLTLREIGQALQLTEGRISQIMRRTLEKLRSFLSSEDFAINWL